MSKEKKEKREKEMKRVNSSIHQKLLEITILELEKECRDDYQAFLKEEKERRSSTIQTAVAIGVGVANIIYWIIKLAN